MNYIFCIYLKSERYFLNLEKKQEHEIKTPEQKSIIKNFLTINTKIS